MSSTTQAEQGVQAAQRRAVAAADRGEQWPVAVVAHHVAISDQAFATTVARLVSGETCTPSFSTEDVGRMNAEHAREYATVGKPEALDKLKTGGAAMSKALGQLDDRQLEQVAGSFGGNEMTVGQVIELIVVAHTAEHLNNIRVTIQR